MRLRRRHHRFGRNSTGTLHEMHVAGLQKIPRAVLAPEAGSLGLWPRGSVRYGRNLAAFRSRARQQAVETSNN
jgi:hypothetical protein